MTLQEYKGAIRPQQARFAELYIANGYNGTQAAIGAEYAANSAHVTASKLLKDAKVKAYVDALDAEKWKGVQLDPEVQKKRMEWLLTSDIRQYLKFDGKKISFKSFDELTDQQAYAIKGIKQTKYGIELTLHDKSWSIPEVNRILGMYAKDNGQRGEGFAEAVAMLLPDNTRGKIVPLDPEDITE